MKKLTFENHTYYNQSMTTLIDIVAPEHESSFSEKVQLLLEPIDDFAKDFEIIQIGYLSNLGNTVFIKGKFTSREAFDKFDKIKSK